MAITNLMEFPFFPLHSRAVGRTEPRRKAASVTHVTSNLF